MQSPVNKFGRWCNASSFQEFHASVDKLDDTLALLSDSPSAAVVGLASACAGLANGYCLLIGQPGSICQPTEELAKDIVTVTLILQRSIALALGDQHTPLAALRVAQGIAASGLLSEYARVCSAVAYQLSHHQQQQQQQRKKKKRGPPPTLHLQVLLNSLLHVWDQLQCWWPGKKLAGAKGLAVTIQPLAELLVAIMQKPMSFGSTTDKSRVGSGRMRVGSGDSCPELMIAKLLLDRPADRALHGIRCILDIILQEAHDASIATPEVQQLLSSTALQLLSAISLGLPAQWQFSQRQGRSTIVEPAVSADGQGSSSGGRKAQQQEHLQVPAHHLLLWDTLQCPVNTFAIAPLPDSSDPTVVNVASAAISVFDCCAYQQIASSKWQRHVSDVPPDSSADAACLDGINSSSPSHIASFKVPYLQLMLVAAELQLLNPDLDNTRLLLCLMQQLLVLHCMDLAQDAAANPGTNSLHTQVMSAVLGPLGLGVRHACQLEASSAQGNSSSAAAGAAGQQQHNKATEEREAVLLYGKLLMSLCLIGCGPDLIAEVSQDTVTSISNLELGMRLQAEASITVSKQEAAAAAAKVQQRHTEQSAVLNGAEATAKIPTAGLEYSYVVTTTLMNRAVHNIAVALSLLLQRLRQEGSTGGSATDQEPVAAAVSDLKQPLAAVVALLSTLKVLKALAQSDGSQSMASDCVAHAAGVLSGLAGFNCQLAMDAGDNGNSQLWRACITLAARSFIAIGDGLARAIACDSVVGPGECVPAQPVEASTESDQAQVQKMPWLEMLQGVEDGVGWVYEQLLLLRQPPWECATSTGGDQAALTTTDDILRGSMVETDQNVDKMLRGMFSNADQLYKVQEQCDTILEDIEEALDSSQHATDAGGNCTAPISSLISMRLAQQLQQLGIDLCAAVHVPCCCNNPGCYSFRGESEQQLVSGKGCVCGGCQVARYCGVDCQTAHWPQHKAACKRLKRQLR